MPNQLGQRRDRFAACRVAILLAAIGCHAEKPATTPGRLSGEVVAGAVAGARVVTIVRPSSGVLRLSLWLDAGSRDASPPQVATLAAWIAAEAAGTHIEATVYPDATELARTCPTADLGACALEFGRALSMRAPSAAQTLRARDQLRDGRRRALTQDPLRRGDAAALHALIGDEAAGFFPLGESSGDERADDAAIDAFLRAHYGPTRALFIAAGDADPEQVRAAISAALRTAVAASALQASRGLGTVPSARVETLIDDRNALVLLAASRTLAEAVAISRAVEQTLAVTERCAAASSQAFLVRGGALTLVRAPCDDVETTLALITRELSTALKEGLPASEDLAHGDDLVALSRNYALTSLTASTTALATPAFALAAVLRGTRGDTPRSKAPDDALQARMQARLQDIATRAADQATPKLRGTQGARATSVITENGARIEVRRVRGPSLAISVRSALGAGLDPPLLLGRSALLATLTSTACAGLQPAQLEAELSHLQATLTPDVDAESYGVNLRLPSAAWRQGVALALRCMLHPSRDAVHVADATLRLQTRLAAAPELSLRALVASIAAPRAPGVYAPWGDPARLGNQSPRELIGLMADARSAARLSVSVVGDVDAQEAALSIARRVGDLPRGALPRAVELGQPGVRTEVPSPSAQQTKVLVVWQAPTEGLDAIAARVGAAALRAGLESTPGVEITWHDGDAYDDDAWAALVLRVTPAALPTLAEALHRAATRVDDAALTEALVLARDRERNARQSNGSRVDIMADNLAQERLGARKQPLESVESALKMLTTLMRAVPTYVALD